MNHIYTQQVRTIFTIQLNDITRFSAKTFRVLKLGHSHWVIGSLGWRCIEVRTFTQEMGVLHVATWPMDMQRDEGARNTVTAATPSKAWVNYFWYDQTLRRTSETSATYRTWKQDLTLTTSLSRQPVQGIVTLTVSTDLAAKRERGGGGQGTAVGIDVNDGNLDGRVVLRGDEAVWRRLQSAQQNRIFCPVVYEHSLVAAHLRGT